MSSPHARPRTDAPASRARRRARASTSAGSRPSRSARTIHRCAPERRRRPRPRRPRRRPRRCPRPRRRRSNAPSTRRRAATAAAPPVARTAACPASRSSAVRRSRKASVPAMPTAPPETSARRTAAPAPTARPATASAPRRARDAAGAIAPGSTPQPLRLHARRRHSCPRLLRRPVGTSRSAMHSGRRRRLRPATRRTHEFRRQARVDGDRTIRSDEAR